jgi:hypothetical protein
MLSWQEIHDMKWISKRLKASRVLNKTMNMVDVEYWRLGAMLKFKCWIWLIRTWEGWWFWGRFSFARSGNRNRLDFEWRMKENLLWSRKVHWCGVRPDTAYEFELEEVVNLNAIVWSCWLLQEWILRIGTYTWPGLGEVVVLLFRLLWYLNWVDCDVKFGSILFWLVIDEWGA